MIEINVPGYKTLQFKHLVLDYNGTIAKDGELIAGVETCMDALSDKMNIHVLTADTFGNAARQLEKLPCILSALPPDNQDIAKLNYVKQLGYDHSVCIGNGRNDRLMLKEASLGIAVIQKEGIFSETLISSDVICTDIISAMELLLYPLRLIATLRS